MTGDRMLLVLSALAHPHRLRILAMLHAHGRNYVSQLAREIGISRPLLHLHLRKLEDAALVSSQLELAQDGKAHKYFAVTDFSVLLTPAVVTTLVGSLASPSDATTT